MKIVVTGAAGFIGQHLCKELSDAHHLVVGFDVRPLRRDGVSSNYKHVISGTTIDCSSPALEVQLGWQYPDVVIHLAAKVGRLFGEDDVQHTIMDNAAMTANVAKACGNLGVPLMYASTSEVYGDWGHQLCLEDDPFTRIPHNTYGLSKRWGEEVCKLYAPDGLTIMRFSMPYGPGLPAGKGRAALINFLYSALHLEPITVHRDSERSWCWIGDTVRGVRLLLEQQASGAFNIGRDDNAVPMRIVAEMACDLAGAPYELIREVDAPPRQTVVKRLATSKIRDLGWRPEVSLEDGMERVYEWVRETYPLPVAA